MVMFCLTFTSLPMLSGSFDSHALAKNITLNASAYGQHGATLRWNKIKSPNSGYAVFRDGSPIAHLGKSKTSFTDSGLDSGTAHTYQIKTYVRKTKKQWFNKKTQKWQSKKPAKKYRGKSRKVYTYSYKKKSNSRSIRTDYAYYTITFRNWNGAVVKTQSYIQGSTPSCATPTRPADDNYTYTFSGWSPSITAAWGNKTYTAQYKATAKPKLAAPTNVKCVVDNDAKRMTVTWNAVSGATGYYVYKDFSGKSQRKYTDKKGIVDIDVTEGVTYTYYVRAINGDTTSEKSSKVTGQLTSQGSGDSGGTDTPTTPTNPEPTTQTVTVTDYLGVTRTFTKKSTDSMWTCTASSDGSTGFGTNQMVRYDKNIDGTFKNNNNHTLRTYHGATFNVTAIDNFQTDDRTMSFYTVEMYNGDPSKLQLVLDSDVQILERNTFEETGKYTYTPKKKYYYYKNGHPIGKTYDDGAFAKDVKESKSGYTLNKKVFYVNNSAMSIGDALGIWTDKFNVTVKYDGEVIGTVHVDTAKDVFFGPSWTTDNCNGMSPFRRKALEIAQQALRVKGKSGNLDTDLNRIDEYVKENYSYAEPITVDGATVTMTCYFGAIILETYSIYEFGEFGFEGSGSNYNASSGKHSVFVLDKSPHPYYETQGTHDGQYDSDVGYF